MKKFISLNTYLLVGLNALLIFVAFFSDQVALPTLMKPLGRMHPLFLHLPIGFFIICLFLYLFKKEIPEPNFLKFSLFLWSITGVFSAISAIFGVFLAAEGGYSPELMFKHKWFGVAFSVFCLIIFVLQYFKKLLSYLVGLLLIMVAGHLGSNLTHGQNFLFEALETKQKSEPISKSSSLYKVSIKPILEAKCLSCHNQDKKKGGLNLEDVESILKGGKNGDLWLPGNSANSLFIKRALLPENHKEHMPPKGSHQLTPYELHLISQWIDENADFKKSIAEYSDSSSLKKSVLNNLDFSSPENQYDFSKLSEKDFTAINTPYCTVYPISNTSNALEANFYVAEKFELVTLKNLLKAKKQLISLNIAKMPITNKDLEIISEFKNLETLNLNSTNITSEGLNTISKLSKLENLSLAITKQEFDELSKNLKGFKKLKHLYLWQSNISEEQINKLKANYPTINFNLGYKPLASEIIKLNEPQLENKEFIITKATPIIFKHSLPNINLRYTLDGTEPDSINSKQYTKPITIDKSTNISIKAYKEGWISSNSVNYNFFLANKQPDTTFLLSKPNPQYLGLGATALTNKVQGEKDNFKSQEWLGFKKSDAEMVFKFEKPIKEITLSYLKNNSGYIFPPLHIKLYGSNTNSNYKLINTIYPNQSKLGDASIITTATIKTSGKNYNYYKLIAKPIPKLPKWHAASGERAWLFIDEVYFN